MSTDRARILLWLCLCACSACGPSDGGTLHRSGEPDVIRVLAEDGAMNAAIARARATLPDFQRAMASPPEGSEFFSVKIGFPHTTGDGVEHIWLTEPEFASGEVSGVVNNEPVDVTTLKLGQRVTAPITDVSDWMYLQNGVLRGGYTIRVLFDRKSPEERAQALSELGFRFE